MKYKLTYRIVTMSVIDEDINEDGSFKNFRYSEAVVVKEYNNQELIQIDVKKGLDLGACEFIIENTQELRIHKLTRKQMQDIINGKD